ncbi:ABC transporter substrate-binding protein [Brevibacillus migulae]|uniref:ABC transporter substrate-binding protein n=1 Tax=Brevibacillus migulae TaxID=1644114 RepID=UPI001F1B8BCE|nr:ABC transporter substrate-binding protein [Brevibacillus migulae]
MNRRKLQAKGMLLALCLLLTACGTQTGGGNQSTSDASGAGKSGDASGKKLQIGITQIIEHPSLDATREGFIAALKDNGFEDGKNIDIEYVSAQGDPSTVMTIAQKFAGDKKDAILAISTPSAQSLVQTTDGTDIPVFFAAITDPLKAKLIENVEKPGKNVTGISDTHPDSIKSTMYAIKEFFPEAKKVGIIFNSGESNSVVNVDNAKKALAEIGLEPVEANANNTSEVKQAAQSLVGRVDAIYVPKDNTVVAALKSVVMVAEENKIPLFVGEMDSVKSGGFAGYGIDYHDHGYETGLMAVKVLKGEAKPGDLPVQFPKELKMAVNKEAAANQGIDLNKLKTALDKINPVYIDKIEEK